MVLSAIFHTFNSHSREASEFCLMLDLGGISCSITASYISGEAKNKVLVIFRCAGISCTGDRQFVNDGLIETGHPKFKARVWAGEEPNAPLQPKKFYICGS